MPVNEDRLIGPPGTGKTTELARIVNFNASTYGSDNIIVVSLTKAAAAEIAGRKTVIPSDNVGTLHSFAFNVLDRPTIAEDPEHLREFGKYEFAGCNDTEELEFTAVGAGEGDKLLAEYGRLRNLCTPRKTWPVEIQNFAREWEDYKAQTNTMDFSDLIERAALDTDAPLQMPAVMCVDEAQDTSRLQWQLITKWSAGCEKVVTCGDADQTIYSWAGADPAYFTEHKPERQKILEQSYRVPAAVHRFAQDWIRRIHGREDVVYKPRDHPGALVRSSATHKQPEAVLPIIETALAQNKTVMIQTSCEYMLKPIITLLREEGIPFANPWRKKHGGWNPLARRGKTSTAGGIIEFLRPQMTGELWDKAGYERWLPLVKGFFRRGGRDQFMENAMNVHTPDELFDILSRYVQCEEDLSIILTGVPYCTDWLKSRLVKAKQAPAEYPLHCIAKRGPAAIQNDPQVFVGTIHSFKGSEADVVVVFPDLSYQGYAEYIGSGFSEIVRLFYVAVTRARESLYLCAPTSKCAVWS